MFLVSVKTISGQLLTYRVIEYEVKDGHVVFIDPRTGLQKRFSTDRTDIEEVRQ